MIIYGKNVVKEAIYAKRPVYKLYLDEKFSDSAFLAFLKDRNIHFEKKDKASLNELTNNQNHQGVVADVKAYQFKELEEILDKETRQRFLILDELHDPQNLGAILRTVEATSYDGVIISKKHQVPLNATVAKVSSGAIEHTNIILVNNIHQTLLKLQKEGVLVVGTDGSATIEYTDIPQEGSLAIVMGNEGSGIRQLVKQNCNMLVKIPMQGKVNSLNVSVAAALMMYATYIKK
ncbi:RNA 2-O ribose methyltransferase [Alteracholeplasma palmae J233]|uniref:RNA 2-O ribose methyltransferase n=1 Tax=Alteracholeplasma palmae (strain ATCC 49389 / J233) TaxID=1318466 RepID=U4KLR5_ALTPJ|nr:23S rRNA (guanosine(2251)-2'-O)-methyltransferase RlmB [Alteracholeplasma palmae]CCV64862.1 RNA 2-O ribose methyltransferase [Alteracholeplasma palmae J233]